MTSAWSVVVHPQPRPETGRVLTVVPRGVEADQAQGDVLFLSEPVTLEEAARSRTGVLVSSDAPAPLARLEAWLRQSPQLTPVQVGELAVEAQQQLQPGAHCTALNTGQLPALNASVERLAAAVRQDPPAGAYLYGHLLATPGENPFDPDHPGYDERDAQSFLQAIAADNRLSDPVRHAAAGAEQALDEVMLSPAGPRVRLPWRLESQATAHDPWGRLSQAIHAGQAPAASPPATVDYTLAQRAARTAIQSYKKYVSPQLDSGCTGTPSCSQFTREAIERFGVVDGVKRGFMRLITCTDSASHDHRMSSPPPVAPPPARDKSGLRRSVDGALMTAAQAVGTLVGGLAGAVLAWPAGLALGYLAGSGRLRPDPEKYGQKSVEALAALTAPAARAGPVLGAWLGAAGAVAKGASWGGLFGGLLARNLTREACGELPPEYQLFKSP